jgi:hypothetical protein
VQLKTFDGINIEEVVQSEVLSSSMGVPQGTTLGPFGWNSYCNDFPLYILLAILMIFADDSTAIVKGESYKEVNAKTVETNKSVINFAELNFLRLNASKTIIFSKSILIKLKRLKNQRSKYMSKMLKLVAKVIFWGYI